MPKEDQKKEDEKLIPVGEGIETPDESDKPIEKAEEDSDQRVGHSEDDDEPEESGDDGADISPERQKIRERRRREKLNRQRRVALERRELEFLRKRNEEVERELSKIKLRQDQQEDLTADGRIGSFEGQIREAENIHAAAIKAGDGETATEALRVRDQLREAQLQLKASKEGRQRERKASDQRETATAVPEPDPEAIALGKQWVSENDWFDPKLQDEDSFLVRAIEERLAREGRLEPSSPEYWEELNRRIDRRLPGLRKGGKVESESDLDWEDDDERKKPAKKKPGGPRIAIGGKTRSLKPNEVYISEQRKKALMEAGAWDDEATRDRYLKAYKRYDEEALRNS